MINIHNQISNSYSILAQHWFKLHNNVTIQHWKKHVTKQNNVATLTFGLATKAKGLQGCEPRGSLGVTSHAPKSVGKCERVNPHTPKATLTLGNEVPVDSQNFRERFEGSKLNGLWHFLYLWKALGT